MDVALPKHPADPIALEFSGYWYDTQHSPAWLQKKIQ